MWDCQASLTKHMTGSYVLASRKGVSSRNYVGCIKNLEISRSTFDLLRNSYGVRKGCALEVGSKRCRGGLNDGFPSTPSGLSIY